MKTFINIFIEINKSVYKANLYKGKPLKEVPVTYRKKGIYEHSIGNRFNSDLITIYKARNGYRYEIYRDGCFHPYYGKIEFEKDPLF
jgi:hypothetical protein